MCAKPPQKSKLLISPPVFHGPVRLVLFIQVQLPILSFCFRLYSEKTAVLNLSPHLRNLSNR